MESFTHLLQVAHLDLLVEGRVGDGGHTPSPEHLHILLVFLFIEQSHFRCNLVMRA